MREIKFRNPIYSFQSGKFLFFHKFNLYPGVGSSLPAMGSNDWAWKGQEQYTGLKDKNGVEIYEGDFIHDVNHTMLVTWSEKHASFALGRPEWAFLHFFHEAISANRCEVRGNIHENPGLLTDA